MRARCVTQLGLRPLGKGPCAGASCAFAVDTAAAAAAAADSCVGQVPTLQHARGCTLGDAKIFQQGSDLARTYMLASHACSRAEGQLLCTPAPPHAQRRHRWCRAGRPPCACGLTARRAGRRPAAPAGLVARAAGAQVGIQPRAAPHSAAASGADGGAQLTAATDGLRRLRGKRPERLTGLML